MGAVLGVMTLVEAIDAITAAVAFSSSFSSQYDKA